MSDICNVIREKLFELRDEEYKAFHAKLIPTVAVENIIGVRTPILRKYAREAGRYPQIEEFLAALPYLEQRRLTLWTHNKTIQKACESYRITAEQKAYLRSLKEKIPR